MPIYPFYCSSCSETTKILTSPSKTEHVCKKCGAKLSKTLGTPFIQGKETMDEYRDKSLPVDQKKHINERAQQHFVKHDLPRIVQEHGVEFAKRMGLVDEDGNPK